MQDTSIPLLTEVIEVADAKAPARAGGTTARPPASSAAVSSAAVGSAPAAADGTVALDLEQLQAKLTERVLRQLQGRIDFVLEQRIRDSLADVLQLAMAGLTNDIKRGLQHTLEDVIGRAVAQELAKLQHPKK